MHVRESMNTMHFSRCGRNRFAMGYDDAIRELFLTSPICPAMIGCFRQTQVAENGVDLFVGTTLLCQGKGCQNLGFLVGTVTALRSDYQRPFFRRRFSLESSAIPSRRRCTSVSNASSVGRSFLRPRG